MPQSRFGFSTGALEKGNYREALRWSRLHGISSVELSALRYNEFKELVSDLDHLDCSDFDYVSFHAPSSFAKEQETQVVSLLEEVYVRGWNIIVHPDVIYTPSLWQHFNGQLLVENMDRRKTTGRSVAELTQILDKLPGARICLDLAHARQLDTTLGLLWQFSTRLVDRIAEIHISELDSRCKHHVMSLQSIADYRKFARSFANKPVIIESVLYKADPSQRLEELKFAREALPQLQ